MLLAGDVGGTNTRLGLFERADHSPRLVSLRVFATQALTDLTTAIAEFLRDAPSRSPISAAAVGVAGPVVGGRAKLTNASWAITSAEIAPFVSGGRVVLLNDLESLARSVPLLGDADLVTLQAGQPAPDGHRVVVAAGTGFGCAHLPYLDGRAVPVASEAGHADFAARTDRELDLVRMLRQAFGRVEVEQVVSGAGILHLHRFTHGAKPCNSVVEGGTTPTAAIITTAALEGRCQGCVEALDMFVDAYGAEAGNLALRGLATGGVFVGGGIAPKILPALKDGRFMTAFLDKAPMTNLVRAIPVHVIVKSDAALLGAAAAAHEIAQTD